MMDDSLADVQQERKQMIARDSKSYPYLAIAQHYNVPYGEVLRLSNRIIEIIEKGKTPLMFYDWQREIVKLERDKHNETFSKKA